MINNSLKFTKKVQSFEAKLREGGLQYTEEASKAKRKQNKEAPLGKIHLNRVNDEEMQKIDQYKENKDTSMVPLLIPLYL